MNSLVPFLAAASVGIFFTILLRRYVLKMRQENEAKGRQLLPLLGVVASGFCLAITVAMGSREPFSDYAFEVLVQAVLVSAFLLQLMSIKTPKQES